MNGDGLIKFNWSNEKGEKGTIEGTLMEMCGSGFIDIEFKIKTTDNKYGILTIPSKIYPDTKMVNCREINFPLSKNYQWKEKR